MRIPTKVSRFLIAPDGRFEEMMLDHDPKSKYRILESDGHILDRRDLAELQFKKASVALLTGEHGQKNGLPIFRVADRQVRISQIVPV